MFDEPSLALAIVAFTGGGALVWASGTRLTRYAVELGERFHLGRAFSGMLLLGGITSLPELATTVTAALDGRAQLAINNLLGGVSLQVALLAVVDAAIGASAFSAIVPRPSVMIMGALDVLMLAAVLVVILLGEPSVGGIGVGAAAVFLLFLASTWVVSRERSHAAWLPTGPEPAAGPPPEDGGGPPADPAASPQRRDTKGLLGRTVLAGSVILVGGVVVTRSAVVIGAETPLGESFVGTTLLALSTSLPELSTTLAAARMRQYEVAFADIFGTNLFDLGLILVADVFYGAGPLLAEGGRFAALAATLGIVLTAIYLVGLLERRDRVVLRMGYDSLAVLACYAAGLAALFGIR